MFKFNQRKCPDANYTVHKSVCEREYCGEIAKTCKFNKDNYNSKTAWVIGLLLLIVSVPFYLNIAIAFANM
jgi:hypothetical protein